MESLKDLRDKLNRIYFEFGPYDRQYLLDGCGLKLDGLPTFGGSVCQRHDAYSWDDRHYLTYDQETWVIYDR